MAFTLLSFPNIDQGSAGQSIAHSYPLGSFDVDAGQWVRLTLWFSALPYSGGNDQPPGTFYTLQVTPPGGGANVNIGTGVLSGSAAGWLPGGIHGIYQCPTDGTCQLILSTSPTDGTANWSGVCNYSGITAIAETFTTTNDDNPVVVLSVPMFSVTSDDNSTASPLGSFAAVTNQRYKLTCCFDAWNPLANGNFFYNLSSDELTGLPDGLWYSGQQQWMKCCVTSVVTASAETCNLSLVTTLTPGSQNPGAITMQNFLVFIDPFPTAVSA